MEHFSQSARRHILGRGAKTDSDFASALLEILSSPGWIEDPIFFREVHRPLTQIAYFYLTEERSTSGKLINPVASFHIGNGARLHSKNVHFAANRTERGLKDSCGIMVSYVYSSTWLHQLRRSARAILPWEV